MQTHKTLHSLPCPAGRASPSTLVSEPKEVKSLRSACTASLTAFCCVLSKFDQTSLALVQLQAKLCKTQIEEGVSQTVFVHMMQQGVEGTTPPPVRLTKTHLNFCWRSCQTFRPKRFLTVPCSGAIATQ